MSVMQRIADFFTKKSTVAQGGGEKADTSGREPAAK